MSIVKRLIAVVRPEFYNNEARLVHILDNSVVVYREITKSPRAAARKVAQWRKELQSERPDSTKQAVEGSRGRKGHGVVKR